MVLSVGKCGGQLDMMLALACGGYRPLNATIRGLIAYEGAYGGKQAGPGTAWPGMGVKDSQHASCSNMLPRDTRSPSSLMPIG
jgi:hypothetical protein